MPKISAKIVFHLPTGPSMFQPGLWPPSPPLNSPFSFLPKSNAKNNITQRTMLIDGKQHFNNLLRMIASTRHIKSGRRGSVMPPNIGKCLENAMVVGKSFTSLGIG